VTIGYRENRERLQRNGELVVLLSFDLIDCIEVFLFMYLIQFVDLNFSLDCIFVIYTPEQAQLAQL